MSSLTIGLKDLRDGVELLRLILSLNSSQIMGFLEFLKAYSEVQNNSVGSTDYYTIQPTYADIAGFATRINCLVAPQLCGDLYDEVKFWCVRANSIYLPLVTISNICKIVFRLKNLHDD